VWIPIMAVIPNDVFSLTIGGSYAFERHKLL